MVLGFRSSRTIATSVADVERLARDDQLRPHDNYRCFLHHFDLLSVPYPNSFTSSVHRHPAYAARHVVQCEGRAIQSPHTTPAGHPHTTRTEPAQVER